MARPDTGCCCAGGGGSGEVECCGESGNCSSAPTDKYHKLSITVSFRNKYPYNYTWTTPVPAGFDCQVSGDTYPASTTLTQTGKLGHYGSIITRSTFPCGPSTDCHNGELIPNTDPDEYVPGSCAESLGYCVSTCLPYDWETCCSAPGTQPNCGQLSIASLSQFKDQNSNGKFRFTVKASTARTNLTSQRNGVTCTTGCAGCPGFVRATAPTSIIPSSYYIANTNNQEVKWGAGDDPGDPPCPSGYICHLQDIVFYCADSVRNWDGTGAPAGGLKYFYANGRFSSSPPTSSLMPYIELDDYPGAILATLTITHDAVTIDELLIDNGWGSCGWDGGDEGDAYVGGSIGYVATCGTTAYNFSPFGSIGIISNDGTMASRLAASSFSIPHDTDDWTN